MNTLASFKPHMTIVKNAFTNKPLSPKLASTNAASQGDGVDTSHTSFKQVAKAVLTHPATSAVAGAALTGVPVLMLTGNPVAAAVSAVGGAVAGLAVNFGVRVIIGLMDAFENMG